MEVTHFEVCTVSTMESHVLRRVQSCPWRKHRFLELGDFFYVLNYTNWDRPMMRYVVFFCRSLILFLERISVFGCLCICFLLAWWADSPIFINFVSKMWLWFHFSCESNACAIPNIYFNISFSCSTVSWRSPYEVLWEFSYFLEAWSV